MSDPANDTHWMQRALHMAHQGQAAGEVPVGAVLVDPDGRLLAEAFNCPIHTQDPTAHAEILVLREGARRLGNYRLDGCTLYCTLEPCPMCAGAIVHARLRRLVFAARDLRFGGVRSKFTIADSDLLNHQVEISEGTLGAECTELLKTFFVSKR
ncbi:MAG: tRNA adenosine(34) deaminase TadA [Bryobacter sp.]|nr:tRNA adenosine(34) deaminase TadA [Bryobacter sp.]